MVLSDSLMFSLSLTLSLSLVSVGPGWVAGGLSTGTESQGKSGRVWSVFCARVL